MRRSTVLLAILAVALLAACGCTTISTGLSDTTSGRVTGSIAKGSATGIYLFGMWPLTENSDAQAAYNQAVNSVGAKGLRGATMQSTIMNLFIVQLEIVKVRGQAVN